MAEVAVVPEETKQEKDIVTPFTVQALSDKGIDYAKFAETLGLSHVSDDLKAKFEKLGKPLHRYLRRDLIIGHHGLEQILQRVE